MLSDALANLIAKNFIARKDVKAIQLSNGYAPHVNKQNTHDIEYIPWSRADLISHISGSKTFGHYLLNTESQVKLFAFDIDLQKEGMLPESTNEGSKFVKCEDLRAAWQKRSHPGRAHMKYEFKLIAHQLLKVISEELELPCAAAYSGGKGIHVYAFTGLISAVEAREGAKIVLDTLGEYSPTRGDNFFVDYQNPNLSIEVFPKQNSLDGKSFGNLMRLPLGRNLKSTDPTFFIDMTSPLSAMVPVDPEFALRGNPWKSIHD